MQAVDLPQSTPWRVVFAKATGTAHLNNGLPCQDAADWRVLPSGFLTIALADGAGTAPQAETGANLAISAALTSLENSLANQFPSDMSAWIAALHQAFRTAQDVLFAEAQDNELTPGDYATTLTCLVAADHRLAFGQVGDGVLVARTSSGELYTLTQPQRGEYANETLFLTMPEALELAYFQTVELDLSGLAVMSDGLIRLALQLPGYIPYHPFFSPLWTFAARSASDSEANLQLAEFLASERVCARTDDDKTLVIAVLHEDDFPTGMEQASCEAEAEG